MTQPFVCEAKRVVFIRVPKTGSTSVTKIVNDARNGPGWKKLGVPTHIRATSIAEEYVEKYRDYNWFGGVRHPYTWIPSFHRWLSLKNTDERLKWVDNYEIDRGWEPFIESIRWTPFEWIDHRTIDVTPIPQEQSHLWEGIFGVKLPVFNVSDHKKPFELTPGIKALIDKKFSRELKFYAG